MFMKTKKKKRLRAVEKYLNLPFFNSWEYFNIVFI